MKTQVKRNLKAAAIAGTVCGAVAAILYGGSALYVLATAVAYAVTFSALVVAYTAIEHRSEISRPHDSDQGGHVRVIR